MYLLNPIHIVYYVCLLEFTFHYVSIKSRNRAKTTTWLIIFTFHYVSIKSFKTKGIEAITGEFTFHYVSIKSEKEVNEMVDAI